MTITIVYTYPLTLAALTAFQTEATSFAATTQGLAGVGAASPYGPLDVIMHDTTLPVLGDDPSSTYTTATAISPLDASATIAAAQTSAEGIVAQVVAGTMDDSDAATAIDALTAELTAIQTASSNAIGGLRDLLPTLATAQAIGGATISGSTALQAYAALIVQPDALAQLQTAAEAAYFAEPPTLDQQAPLINLLGVIWQWITKVLTGS